MPENVSRNAPCPCGSGKKYKKCCLAKDEQAARDAARKAAEQAAKTAVRPPRPATAPSAPPPSQPAPPLPATQPHPPSPPQPSPQPLSPEEQARDALWDEFEKAEDEAAVAVYLKALDSGLMDGELAFDMLDTLRVRAEKSGEEARWGELVEQLRQRCPEAFREESGYFYDWLIDDALAEGQVERAAEHLLAFAEHPEKHADAFLNALHSLMYHGQLKPLLAAVERALPKVKSAGKDFSYTVPELTDLRLAFALFDYLTTAAAPRADDPALLSPLKPGAPHQSESLAKWIRHLTGQATHGWSEQDFDHRRPRQELRDALDDLASDFHYDLHTRHGLSWTKAELGRRTLRTYLGREAERRQFRGRLRLLCPKPEGLEDHLAGCLDDFPREVHEASCLMEVLPAYLAFLTRHQLMPEAERVRALNSLRPCQEQVCEALREDSPDPALLPALEAAWA